MLILEEMQAKEFRLALNKQYSDVAKFIDQGLLFDIDVAVNKTRARLVATLGKQYRRTATIFNKKVTDVIKEVKLAIPLEAKTPKDEFWRTMNSWNRVQAGAKITKIQKTTRENIQRAIRKGIAEGESHRQIAKRIRNTGKITNGIRARTIAITETHTAAVKSVDAAIASTRIEMEREWVATLDERVRDSHADADGQRTTQDGEFVVNGEGLKYPGDPSGSAENIINCRCVVIYHTLNELDEIPPAVPANSPKQYEGTVKGISGNTPLCDYVGLPTRKTSCLDFIMRSDKRISG